MNTGQGLKILRKSNMVGSSQPGMWECHEDEKNGYVYNVAEDDKELLELNSRNWKDMGGKTEEVVFFFS